MKRFYFIISSLACFFTANAQENKSYIIHKEDVRKLSPLQRMEDTLVYLADSMLSSAIPDSRIDGSYAFIKGMKNLLMMKESYADPLKKLAEKISILNSPDKKLRIYSWEIVRAANDIRYYGVLQFPDGSFQPLIDISDQVMRGAEDSVFYNMRWYGCLYYAIIQKKIGNTDAYFLIGYNGNPINGDKKIVDVFGFDGTGRGIFGAPVFTVIENDKKKNAMRFILNYEARSNVSLNYDAEKDMIIFDHCESQIGDPVKKNTYIPDGTYDGLKWNGNNWNMYRNVIEITDLQPNGAPVEKPIKQ